MNKTLQFGLQLFNQKIEVSPSSEINIMDVLLDINASGVVDTIKDWTVGISTFYKPSSQLL